MTILPKVIYRFDAIHIYIYVCVSVCVCVHIYTYMALDTELEKKLNLYEGGIVLEVLAYCISPLPSKEIKPLLPFF